MSLMAGDGTTEAHWAAWFDTVDLPAARLPAPPREGRPRALVVAAHPDDDVLGAGGLLRRLGRTGWEVDVLWATDGEASHPASTALGTQELARRRRKESLAARGVLGLRGSVGWLGLPDSGLVDHEPALREAVRRAAPGADLLLAPWSEDGHPDHEVCGRAVLEAGAAVGVEVWELPVWAWHWGTGEALAPRWGHAYRIVLSEQEQDIKAQAVAAFATQVRPLGPASADRAVLPPAVLVRFARPFEVVLVTPAGGRS